MLFSVQRHVCVVQRRVYALAYCAITLYGIRTISSYLMVRPLVVEAKCAKPSVCDLLLQYLVVFTLYHP